MTKAPPFITSVRVETSKTGGGHEYVGVFIRSQNVGTLVVEKGDGLRLQELLARGLSGPETALWSAREVLISAARELVREQGSGSVDLSTLRVLAAAVEKYDEAANEVTE